MDGINPTLAFAALFLGLSGHPREAAPDPQQAAIVVPADFGCLALTTAADVPPAVPAGDPLGFDGLNEYQDPGFDLVWMDQLSPMPEDTAAPNEMGCDTSVSQP